MLERPRSAMAPGGGGVESDDVEFVRGAGVKVELDGYVSLAEARGAGEVFVAEHVELGDLDVGGRTPGRVGDAGRGGVGGGVRAAGGLVSRPEPGQRRTPAAPATTYIQPTGLARPGLRHGLAGMLAGYPVTSSAR
jgi:hypothetical protein